VFCLQENTNGGGETGPDAAGFEGAPQSALVSVETFLRTSRESLRSQRAIEDAWLWRDAMASGCDLTGDRITGVVAIGEDDSIVGHGGVSGNGRAGENTNTDGGASSGGAMSLQKKVEGVGSGLNPESEVYLDGFDSMALALRDMAEDVDRAGIRTDTDANRRPPGLVVIASLVDKIPNLAGLARTCEVLGAEALVMADRDRTVAHKDFTAVSVTAEQWLPIRDVSIAGLVPYLLRLRREGYTLVGLEQTRGAVDVNDFEFPRKTALVLGREREGIDADVLSVLDTCVVIEQKGMIRSLNVHVSASVAIAAYARAH
jgi:tRNA(Leu) C34 or U34 (ribose-2'-O)-methylase TrmL